MKAYDAARTWAKNVKPSYTNRSLSFTDKVAWSYAEPIAVKTSKNQAYITNKKFSRTTSRHVSYVREALSVAGYKIYEINHRELRHMAGLSSRPVPW